MREVSLGTTQNFKFWTRRIDTGAPADVASIAVAAYPEGSAAEITAGITVTQPFDSRTGFGNIEVVLTAANGYLFGTNYSLVITTGTINSVSVVGAILGEFQIGRGESIAGGVAQSGSDNGIRLAAATAFVANDRPNGMTVVLIGGTGFGQSRQIYDWTDATDDALVSPDWVTNPDSTSVYEVWPTPPGSTASPPIVTIGAGGIPVGAFVTDSITADAIAADAIGSSEFSNAAASKVMTQAMTEAYAADGAAATPAQALYMIQQMLGEFGVSGVTMTVKKLDGSTSAATFTLNSASDPTSITRAT